ncbi:hypothetical protein HBB16_15290 [Pseudonocardia sp. MCCB 268]|nr:hypothetical protein [Pseudonocardia cytotoxica]
MIGVGYADADRFAAELRYLGTRVGCGFITWCSEREPRQLDLALDHDVAAVMLSFGDVERFAGRIRAKGPVDLPGAWPDEAGRALDQVPRCSSPRGGRAAATAPACARR